MESICIHCINYDWLSNNFSKSAFKSEVEKMTTTSNELSTIVSGIEPSLTMSITALVGRLRSEGQNVIGFGAGEPDFDTPDPIKQAAIAAIESGKSKYTPAAGLPELKSAIVQRLKADYGLDYAPNQIVVSCGAKHSLHNVFFAILNPGDEVIVPAPYWVSYPEQIQMTWSINGNGSDGCCG